ncbi:hypothetical protein HF086_000913 [Spodoptera exigua]|uniref:Peptidase aspartic putative domain-containing protein n=1 Tax=Spodoptera exigua TaxID=7107 RepID=A0A922SHW4_SPOEX|nr:hypothetical protein HF086_000913 [Spodoptera exigua]
MSHTSERASKLQAETTKFPIPCVSVSNLNIKDLCTKRSSIKGRITKYKNYLNTFLEPGKTFSSTDLCSLSQRFQKFEELCTVFEDVQSEIEMLNSSNLDSELDVRDEMELDFSTLIAQTRIFLETNQPHEVDHVSKNLRALNTLGEPTESWDSLIIHLVSAKLDNSSSFKWQEHKNVLNSKPSLKDFFTFLKNRADVLESVQVNKAERHNHNNSSKSEKSHAKAFAISAVPGGSAATCAFCGGSHRIYDCSSFLAKSVEDRQKEAARLKLCINCLRKGHSPRQCRLGPCTICKKYHNSLLHRQNKSQAVNVANVQSFITETEVECQQDSSVGTNNVLNNMSLLTNDCVLLSTVLVDINNPVSQTHCTVRALLDSGSQCSLITESLKNKLQLTTQPTSVDIVGVGSDSTDDLLYIKESVENALSKGCMNLRKYRSNTSKILPNNTGSQNKLILSSSSHILGVGWDPNDDFIHFPNSYENNKDKPTKRSILSDTCKVFDPLGLLSPLTIKPKILVQKLWIRKIDWDTPAPNDICQSWYSFIENMKHLYTLRIPRHTLCISPVQIEMHCFCDASQSAYTACIYLRSVDRQNNVIVRLQCARARLASIKPITIPRLELCACLLGAQLASTVCRALRCVIQRRVFWTDSSIALTWLASRYDKLETFVANRVGAILELTELSDWRHVPTASNPADIASRESGIVDVKGKTLTLSATS